MVDQKLPPEWIAIMRKIRDTIEPDLTIHCGGMTYQVHKLILTPASAFFDKACNGPFREGLNNVIDLPDDDPDVFEAMLAYLAEGNYDKVLQNTLFGRLPEEGWVKNSGTFGDLFPIHEYVDMTEIEHSCDQDLLFHFHLAVHVFGDKYHIRGLMKKAAESMLFLVKEWGDYWNTVSMENIIRSLAESARENAELEDVAKALARHIVGSTRRHLSEPDLVHEVERWPTLSSFLRAWL